MAETNALEKLASTEGRNATAAASMEEFGGEEETVIERAPDDAKAALLQALAAQLEYYFSPTNLARDSYLRSVMVAQGAGSWCPASILAQFANVNRIIGIHDPNGTLLASTYRTSQTTNQLISDHDDYTTSTDPRQSQQPETSAQVPAPGGISILVAEAANISTTLEVVRLTHGILAVGPTTQPNTQQQQRQKQQQQQQQQQHAQIHSSRLNTPITDQTLALESNANSSSRSQINSSKQYPPPDVANGASVPNKPFDSNSDINSAIQVETRSTIILRDVPSEATENDVRSIFASLTSGNTKTPLAIGDVHADVANCWFVTLETTPKEDLVSVLFALRSKKICGESIKARLKTESGVKSFYVESVPASPVSPPNVTVSNTPYRASRGNGGNGNRRSLASHYRGSATSTSHAHAGDRTGAHASGTASRSSGKNTHSATSSSAGDGHFGRGKSSQSHGVNGTSPVFDRTVKSPRGKGRRHRDGGGNRHALDGSQSKNIKKTKELPPPPLLEADFPSLGDKDKVSSRLQKVEGDMNTEKNIAKKDQAPDPHTKNNNDDENINSSSTKKLAAGYAAAVLKPAQTIVPKSEKGSLSSVQSEKTEKNNDSKGSQSAGDKSETSTTTKDDSLNVDDKSSISSKPNSDKSSGSASNPAAWGGGGGKSFADILKKKQSGTQSDEQPKNSANTNDS